MRMRILIAAAAVCACSSSHVPVVPDAGMPDAGSPDAATAPAPAWLHSYDSTFFARAWDVSCAPPDAGPGIEGCISLVRYAGETDAGLTDGGLAPGSNGTYEVLFVRTHADGGAIWSDRLMSGFDPISAQSGGFVDEDARVHMVASGEILVSGSYFGRTFFGLPGDHPNQELGPTTGGSNPFVFEFNNDGSLPNNWADTGNGKELHSTLR